MEVCVFVSVCLWQGDVGRTDVFDCLLSSPPSASLCVHMCVYVCELHKQCYESVIRVVTHLSNAPIPLGCHTL